MTSTEETLQRIRTALASVEYELEEPRDGMPAVALAVERLHEALTLLRDEAGFETLTFVTAVDRDGARGQAEGSEQRFEVIHQLHSIRHADRVRIRTRLVGSYPSLPTCTDLWPGASFMERECWDMFGVTFDGHPDLRRLLMPEGYGHHPLRKEFPHQGIEPDRLFREWDQKRRAEQEAKPS